MNSDLKKLYSPIIKSHNDAPHHFEKRMESTWVIKAYNPICGDRFELYLNQKEGKLEPIHFHGFGCAISKASTSLLTKSVEGKTIEDAKDICGDFLKFIDQEYSDGLTLPEEFLAFAGVHNFPERYDCAILSWKELKFFLEHITNGTYAK